MPAIIARKVINLYKMGERKEMPTTIFSPSLLLLLCARACEKRNARVIKAAAEVEIIVLARVAYAAAAAQRQ